MLIISYGGIAIIGIAEHAMKKQTLTQSIIDASGSGMLWDSVCEGLGVRIHKNTKSYIFREKSKTNAKTIGACSHLNLVQARKIAVTFGARLVMDCWTFSDLAAEWGANWGQFQRARYKSEDLRRLNKYILPSIGDLSLKEITGRQIIQLHNRISMRGKIEANRCIALVSAIFNKAIEWDLFNGRNPALSVKKHSESPRNRVANEDEVIRLLRALNDHPLGTMFLLCLTGGLRKGEAARIKWSDINFNTNSLALRKTKNKKDHIVFFSEDIKKRLIKEQNGQSYLFYSAATGSWQKDYRRAWKRILKAADIEALTIHDLRATFATRLLNAGVDIAHVSKALNHSSIAVTDKHYNRLGIESAKKAFFKAQEIFK